MTAIIKEFPIPYQNIRIIVNGKAFKAYSNSFLFDAAIYGLTKEKVEAIWIELVGPGRHEPSDFTFDAASITDLPNLKSLGLCCFVKISDASLLPKSLESLSCWFYKNQTLDLPRLTYLSAHGDPRLMVDATKCPLVNQKLSGYDVKVATSADLLTR